MAEVSPIEKPMQAASYGEEEKTDDSSDLVPQRYQGTDNDKRDMSALGKKQQLRRNFALITMVGFASTVSCSWEVLLPLFSFILTDGGTADLFWGFIALCIVMTLVYASLAEMASM